MAQADELDEVRSEARRLLETGDARGALSRLQSALTLAVGDQAVLAEVQLDLVRAYLAAGRIDDAVNLACTVAEDRPADAHARQVLAEAADQALRRRRYQAAEWAGESLTVVAPHDSAGWSRRVAAQRNLGDTVRLGRTLRAWVDHCPHDEEAMLLLRAHQGDWADAAPAESVRTLFDRYAPEFDEHLAQLGYRAPDAVSAKLASVLAGRPVARCADLGCGTGLVGPLVRSLVGHLVGVDLSPGMLQVARERGVYDELLEGELVAFLRERPNEFDALVSADTLNYLGNLRPVFASAHGALAARGAFVFTLETAAGLPSVGFRLTDNGRFEHDAAHVDGLLRDVGFEPTVEPAVLRREGNREVEGLLVTAVLPGA